MLFVIFTFLAASTLAQQAGSSQEGNVNMATFTAINLLLFDFNEFAKSLKPTDGLQCPLSSTGKSPGEPLPSVSGLDWFRICVGCQSRLLPLTCDRNGNADGTRTTQCIDASFFKFTASGTSGFGPPVPVPKGTFQLLSSLTSLTWSRADPPVGLSELSGSGALQSLTLSGSATSVTTELQFLTSLTSLTIELPNVLTMPSGIGKLTRLCRRQTRRCRAISAR
jgi:hypothetical protein